MKISLFSHNVDMMSKKDGDAKKIGDALKRSTTLRSIDISVAGLTVHGAKSLASGIFQSKLTAISFKGEAAEHVAVMGILYRDGVKQSKTIRSVTIANPVGDVDAFVDMLYSLETLKFWCSTIAMDTGAATKLAIGIARNTTIQELCLYFEDQSCNVVESLLLSTAKRSDCLNKLFIKEGVHTALEHRNEISPIASLSRLIRAGKAPKELGICNCSASEKDWSQFGQSLASSLCSIQVLSVTKSVLPHASIKSLSESLKHNTSLQQLCMCRNELGNDGLKVLAEGLACNSSITSLKLTNNHIGDQGISDFARLWTSASAIECVDLSCNAIGPVGAHQLLKTTTNHRLLQSLSLAENVNIGIKGLQMIGEVLPTLKLKTLDISSRPSWELSSNTLYLSRGFKATELAVKKVSGLALVKGLESNFCLHELSVSSVDIPVSFKKDLRFYTDLNKQGRFLLTKQNELPPMIWCHLLAKCRHPSFIDYFLLQKPETVSSF
jgi:hypothetical protein